MSNTLTPKKTHICPVALTTEQLERQQAEMEAAIDELNLLKLKAEEGALTSKEYDRYERLLDKIANY